MHDEMEIRQHEGTLADIITLVDPPEDKEEAYPASLISYEI